MMNTQPSQEDAEALSHILLGDENEADFKTALLYVAFCTILKRPNITLAQMVDALSAFGVDESKTLRVLSQLTGQNAIGAGCVTKWTVARSGVTHYNFNRKRCYEFECWMDKAEVSIPALKAYRPFRVTSKPLRVATERSHQYFVDQLNADRKLGLAGAFN